MNEVVAADPFLFWNVTTPTGKVSVRAGMVVPLFIQGAVYFKQKEFPWWY